MTRQFSIETDFCQPHIKDNFFWLKKGLFDQFGINWMELKEVVKYLYFVPLKFPNATL